MSQLLQYPVDAYDWVYHSYGFVGVMVSVLLIVLCLISSFIWLDRRK